MKLTRDILLNVLFAVVKKNPKDGEAFKSAIVNHTPSIEAQAVMEANLSDIARLLTVGDVFDISNAIEIAESKPS